MILGHEHIRNRLRRAIEKGRIAQVYLFSGPEGVGKRSVALEFFSLLSGNEAPSSVIEIKPERIEEKGKVREGAISVETIRETISNLGHSSFSPSGKRMWRALLIDHAHMLSESAQNAFLKTLEEPFPNTVIILVTHEEGLLLETIRSRCERVSFSLVPEAILRENFPDADPDMIRLGRPGILFLAKQEKESVQESVTRFKKLLSFSCLPSSERFSLAEYFSNDIPEAERVLSWWMGWLTRRVREAPSSAERRRLLHLLAGVFATLRDLRRFPGSARMTIEHLFFFGKSVVPLFSR